MLNFLKLNTIKSLNNHLIDYPTYVNTTYIWSFGSCAGLMLVLQIVTGLLLSFHYFNFSDYSFFSIEHIMRDVHFGWFFRYLHANGASLFFLVLYLHVGKGLFYKSYIYPRSLIWSSGIIIFLLVMAAAFLGYVLPWGQMSFWGATVITNLFSVIPFYGPSIASWIWGGYAVDYPTLSRFFSFHFIIPIIIAGLVIVHLILLHQFSSSSNLFTGEHIDSVSFYPYFFIKDFLIILFFFTLLSYLVFFNPNLLGHPDNYIKANPLSTPLHIVPEWYFLPFYAILRSVPNKVVGVILMFFSIILFLFLPFGTSKLIFLNTAKYRYYTAVMFWFFIFTFVFLGVCGSMPAIEPYITLSFCLMLFYFFYFFLLFFKFI